MKYGIIFKPSDEYVVFDSKDDKRILFTEDEEEVSTALNDLLFADGGYDEDNMNFQIVTVDYNGDGSEYIKNEDVMFIDKNLIK